MAFVNEWISKEDFEKYKIAELDKKYHGRTKPRDWQIDRERNIFLRELSSGHELHNCHIFYYLLYWQGEFVRFEQEIISVNQKDPEAVKLYEEGCRNRKIRFLEVPPTLHPQMLDIKKSIKTALEVSFAKDNGQNKSYFANIEFVNTLQGDSQWLILKPTAW